MFGIRPFCTATVVLFVASRGVFGTDIPIDFTLLASDRTETYSYSTGDTSTTKIQQHGTMNAVLTFDPRTLRPTAIRFNGGVVHESSSSYKNTANINFYGLGKKQVTIAQSSSGVQFRVDTIGAAQPIDPDGWLQNMERFQSYPTAGILTAKITIDGRTQSQSKNIATDPPDLVEPAIGTEIRLQVFELENLGSTSRYKITLNAAVDGERSRRMPNTDTTLISKTSGTTVAEAEFSAPNAFGQWLLDSGYTLDDEYATNRKGIHLAVLFALKMSANGHRELPWSIAPESKSLVMTLRLPDEGLEGAIQVVVCHDLKTGHWEALSDSDFLDSNSNLDRGASGVRRIRFSGSPSQFYRIVPGNWTN